MALSEFQQAQVTKRLTAFCDSRVPPAMRDKPRIGFRIKGRGRFVEMPASKLRYVATQGVWRLFCQHRDRRWHAYEALPEAPSLAKLLHEVAEDPTGIFRG